MITVQEFRAFLPEPERSKLSDLEVKRIMDIGYSFADAIFDQWLKEQNKSKMNQEQGPITRRS